MISNIPLFCTIRILWLIHWLGTLIKQLCMEGFMRSICSQVLQKMGNLPGSRTNAEFPFQQTGADLAGPVLVQMTKSRGRRTIKAHIALFVWMNTHAIHFELVEDYRAEVFIAAFFRFIARRGHCSELFSDLGIYFVGADACLQWLFKECASDESVIVHELVTEGTQWQFNPSSALHFGGLWEAGVKSAKHHYHRVIEK